MPDALASITNDTTAATIRRDMTPLPFLNMLATILLGKALAGSGDRLGPAPAAAA